MRLIFPVSKYPICKFFNNNSNNVILIYRSHSTSGSGSGAAKIGLQTNWRRIWTRWIPIPTGVGITILAVLQWRNIHNKEIQDQQQLQKSIVNDWEITCYRSVPLRPLSRAWGWISDRPVPMSLRHWVYNKYSRMYSVNLDEVENELISYSSLAEFFSRRLKEGVRPIDLSHCIVSPADGKILNFGEVTSCQIEQVKGITYSLQTFLGDLNLKELPYIQKNYLRLKHQESDVRSKMNSVHSAARKDDSIFINNGHETNVNSNNNNNNNNNNNCDDNENYNNLNINHITSSSGLGRLPWSDYKKLLLKNPDENELYQFVVYLAPGDYHRFHSPVHWNVHYRRHFQGELLSVNPRIASWIPELFSLNERVIYFGEWEHGFFSMAAVGATNVGSIRVHTDKTLHTNGRKWAHGVRYKDKKFDMLWEKGQEVGEFRMGSTIVVLFEAPKNYKFNICSNQIVKVGQSVTCPLKCDVSDNKG